MAELACESKRKMARALAVLGASLLVSILLAVLKVTGVINWSWWWVTFPLWMHLLWFFPALLLYLTVLCLVLEPIVVAFLKIRAALQKSVKLSR